MCVRVYTYMYWRTHTQVYTYMCITMFMDICAWICKRVCVMYNYVCNNTNDNFNTDFLDLQIANPVD